MMNRKLLFAMFIACLFISSSTYAQLPAFSLSINSTPETCPGNATLTFNVANTNPAANITYNVFLLPDINNPIAVLTTTNFIDGLTSGSYRVVATQQLGADSNLQVTDVVISRQLTPLAFTISSTNATCGNNGTMTVSVNSGAGAFYEIIDGPVLLPLQNSPTFIGLVAGVYQVRVFDICGQGLVATHRLFSTVGNGISLAESAEAVLISCNQIKITNTISADALSAINYPLTLTYTVFPPDGGPPVISTQTYSSGDSVQQQFAVTIPYYDLRPYRYSVKMVDGCLNEFNFEDIQVVKPFVAAFGKVAAGCGSYFLAITLGNYSNPISVVFTRQPAGFNPTSFVTNSLPLNGPTINYGSITRAVPFGEYAATITDGCGRTVTIQTLLEPIPPAPSVTFQPQNGCNSNFSKVKVRLDGYIFATAVLTLGTPAYSGTYPLNVSNFINSTGALEIPNMPEGFYKVRITDTCGNVYVVEITVPGLSTVVTGISWPSCELGKGAVRIRGTRVNLVSVKITSAPTTYATIFPIDVSNNINATSSDIFSLNGLPAGEYKFLVRDECGLSHNITVVLKVNTVTENTHVITPYCGSFDLELLHTSNVIAQTFWLQRYDIVNNTWGHPQTNIPAIAGALPNAVNSYRLVTNAVNYNISFLGEFRIVKKFETFENGRTGIIKYCTDVIQQFTYENLLQITDIKKVTCTGQNSDVYITAEGLAPFTYQITKKNGLPFLVDNGSNNVFTDLQPAVYEFTVFDRCGNIAPKFADVALLPSLVSIVPAAQLQDYVICDGAEDDGVATFHLSDMVPQLFDYALPSNFILTFHANEADAIANVGVLPNDYATGTSTIYCRVTYPNNTKCYDLTSFDVVVNPFLKVNLLPSYTLCNEGDQLTLTADSGFDSYTWTSSNWTNSQSGSAITVTDPGLYTITVTKTTNGIECTGSFDVAVTRGQLPSIQNIEISDWSNNHNTIVVRMEADGDFLYSIDNVTFQTSNTFENLLPGDYTVVVKDAAECKIIFQEVHLLNYPRFFTPNQDGFNDMWQIVSGASEPAMKIFIYDRYGKLLKQISAQGEGWDGTYNGHAMPSADYWFTVVRESGKLYRGHFSIKR